MTRKSNQPLLDELTDAQRKAVLDGADAVKELADFRRRTFELWMRVARGVVAICIVADQPGMSRKARKHLLADNGYGTLNEGTVSRLKRMAEHETAIRIWRDTLTQNKRDSWNSPTSICNRCPAVRKAIEADKANKPPRKPRTVNRPLAVERALDTIGDYLHDLDADNRLVMIERILLPFGLRPVPVDAPTKPVKPKAKAKKAEATTDALAGGNAFAIDYESIAKRQLPHGYQVESRKRLSGMHYGDRKLIKAPRPVTAKSLYIFLHECAHAYLHTGSGKGAPRHVKEMEAEQWAHAKMEQHGIAVPPEMTERARRYIARKIVQAERRGARNIDPRAVEYAGSYLDEMRAKYEKAVGKSRHPRATR
jgi:hypothetical protein